MSRRLLALVLVAFFAVPASNAAAAESFVLGLSIVGNGEVECEVEGVLEFFCESEYEDGTAITLIPVPEPGFEFSGWSGDCSGAGNCELTMDKEHSVTATFEEESPPEPEFTLSVTKSGGGTGTVTSIPTGIDCGSLCAVSFVEGTEITLSATPAAGSTFAGWSGSGCSGTGSCEVRMDEAHGVVATFEKVATQPPPPVGGTATVGPTAQVKSGKAQLKLTCKGEGPCKGSLKLTAKIKSGGKTKNLTIGKASFSIAAGATKTLKVKLSGAAKQALAKGKHGTPLKAKARGVDIASSTVTLKPPKK
jgi:hypothetical protein